MGGGGCRVYCNFHWNAGVGEVQFNIPLGSCIIPLGNILLWVDGVHGSIPLGSCTIFIVGVEVGGGGGGRVYCNFHWNAGVGEVHFNIPLGSCIIPLGNRLLWVDGVYGSIALGSCTIFSG